MSIMTSDMILLKKCFGWGCEDETVGAVTASARCPQPADEPSCGLPGSHCINQTVPCGRASNTNIPEGQYRYGMDGKKRYAALVPCVSRVGGNVLRCLVPGRGQANGLNA